MNKQFSFLSGLPRTGSTLLSSILSQNPQIHSEGVSRVCELIWQVYINSANEKKDNWNDDILASERQNSITRIIQSIPHSYYADVNKPFVLDKCRSWTSLSNVTMIKKFITDNPKIIVPIRPTEEIVASFVHLRIKNKWDENDIYEQSMYEVDSTIEHLIAAKENNQGEFLFVHYDEIVFDIKKTLGRIYDFCEWPKYEHDLKNITRPFIQKDEIYGMIGLHDVRKTVEKQKYNIDLPKNILKKCHYYNSLIFED